MLNLSSILDALTEEQMDRVLEFKAGGKHGGGCHSKSKTCKSSKSSKSKTCKSSKSKSCTWKSGCK